MPQLQYCSCLDVEVVYVESDNKLFSLKLELRILVPENRSYIAVRIVTCIRA